MIFLLLIAWSDKFIGLLTETFLGVNGSNMLSSMASGAKNKIQTSGALKASHNFVGDLAKKSIPLAGLGLLGKGAGNLAIKGINKVANFASEKSGIKERKDGFANRNKDDGGKVHKLISRQTPIKSARGIYANGITKFVAPKAARIGAMLAAKQSGMTGKEAILEGRKASEKAKQNINKKNVQSQYKETQKKYGTEAAQGLVRRKETEENKELMKNIEKAFTNVNAEKNNNTTSEQKKSEEEQQKTIKEKQEDAADMSEMMSGLTDDQILRAVKLNGTIQDELKERRKEERLNDYEGIDAKEESKVIFSKILNEGEEGEVRAKQEKFDKKFSLDKKANEEYGKDEVFTKKAELEAQKAFNESTESTGKSWNDLSQDEKERRIKDKMKESYREETINNLAEEEKILETDGMEQILGKEGMEQLSKEILNVQTQEIEQQQQHIANKIEIEAKRQFRQMSSERQEKYRTTDGLIDTEKLVSDYKKNEDRAIRDKSNELAAKSVQLGDKLPESKEEQLQILSSYNNEADSQAIKLAIAVNEIQQGKNPKEALKNIDLFVRKSESA